MISRRDVLAAAMGIVAVPALAAPTRQVGGRSGNTPPVSARVTPTWETLPPTPTLPAANREGLVEVDGVPLYRAEFGAGPPVICLHGGLANACWWGHLVPDLARDHRVVVMDTRGHGRSPLPAQAMSYAVLARDVAGMIGALNLGPTAIVGWSDGAIAGFHLALTRPDLVTRLYAFGINFNPGELRGSGARHGVFPHYVARCKVEHAKLSGRPAEFARLESSLEAMWRVSPNYSNDQVASVKVPVTVSDGDHDEIIDFRSVEAMAKHFPNGRTVTQASVSHFAMVQNPAQFNRDVLTALLA